MLVMQAGHMSISLYFVFPFLEWLVMLFQIFGQPIERTFPKFSIFFDPLRRLLERLGVELHFVNAPIASSPQQTGFLENAKMFRNGGQRHGVRPCQVGHASAAPSQMRQDPPARRISQRGESSVQRCRRIFNHPVNYLACSFKRAKIFLLQFAEAAGSGRAPPLPSVVALRCRGRLCQTPCLPALGISAVTTISMILTA